MTTEPYSLQHLAPSRILNKRKLLRLVERGFRGIKKARNTSRVWVLRIWVTEYDSYGWGMWALELIYKENIKNSESGLK